MTVLRIAALLPCLLLAACGGGEPVHYEPPSYDYLTKLRLNVATIDINDSWAPHGSGRHVEYLAPTPPATALRQVAEDRLVPAGAVGRAVFTIDDASIVVVNKRYQGSLTVHLDVLGGDGNRRGSASAHVNGTRAVTDDDDETIRADLDTLTRNLMNAMNVELEYQVRHGLASELQTGEATVPPPAAVQTEDLGKPKAH